MDSSAPKEDWSLPELTRARRAIVVVDVVESVRLMQEDEAGFIERWRRFVHQVRTEVLPKHGGRLVKSLGDGMLLTFARVSDSVESAFAMHALAEQLNVNSRPQSDVLLRAGVHQAPVVEDELDVYGAGVNLAARLAGLGAPGEVIVSADARDELIGGLDASFEDMGECFLKHVELPVRAFRLTRVDTFKATLLRQPALVPTLAVLPFATANADDGTRAVGQVAADDLACAMAKVSAWRVLSPLTTSRLASRHVSNDDLRRLTGSDYVVSGSVVVSGDRIDVRAHLTETATGELVWSSCKSAPLTALLSASERLGAQLCAEILAALLTRELRSARQAALPNLRGYTLLLHAVALMHRCTRTESDRAQAALCHLIERHPRAADAHAWLAKWHFLRLPFLQSPDPAADLTRSRASVARALDVDPEHGLAGALEAHLLVYQEAELDDGLAGINRSLEHNPSEALAWVFKANALTMLERGDEAVLAIERARALSPLDPLGYYYDMYAAAAYRVAGQHAAAIEYAARSVRHNAMHLPGLVELILAQAAAGDMDAARASASRYVAIRPAASVSRFSALHPARGRPLARIEAEALHAAGIPA